jgi:hypothetical protein
VRHDGVGDAFGGDGEAVMCSRRWRRRWLLLWRGELEEEWERGNRKRGGVR